VPSNASEGGGPATQGAPAGDECTRSIFVARNLCKIYRTGDVEVHALRDVEQTIYQSEFVVPPGASGRGKYTLPNILGGLDVPTSGEAHFADHQLWCRRSRVPCGARDANERGSVLPGAVLRESGKFGRLELNAEVLTADALQTPAGMAVVIER
jgi:energy-coupling factor transporter ATP-binding protein EcfA2